MCKDTGSGYTGHCVQCTCIVLPWILEMPEYLDSENIGADVCQTGNIERKYWENEYRENIGMERPGLLKIRLER